MQSKNGVNRHSYEYAGGRTLIQPKRPWVPLGTVPLAAILLAGCQNGLTKPDAPNAGSNVVSPAPSQPVANSIGDLPVFAAAPNEVEIGGDMNSVDPTLVLGSIIDATSGEIRSLDNVLKDTAKPAVKPESSVAFDNLIDNSLTINASWLSFLKGQVSDEDRAEVSVTETSQVTIALQDIDNSKLMAEVAKVPPAAANNYGICIGYIDYVISAQILHDAGVSASANGYGAAIGGQWYSKATNTSAYHKLVAIWAPLPFISNASASAAPPPPVSPAPNAPPPAPNVVKPAPVSLVDVTKSAITRGELSVTHMNKAASLSVGP